MRENNLPPSDDEGGQSSRGDHKREPLVDSVAVMQRQPIPRFWLAVEIGIIICVLISAVIVIVKL
jgi:hypothetical protein